MYNLSVPTKESDPTIMTEVYGPGAFLLAGTEMYRMAEDAPKQNATIRRTVFRKLQLCFPIDRRG